MIKSIKNIFQTHKSYDLVSATTDSNMEKELHDEVKKGITLKRTKSVDKSAPITQAEIEEAPSASIDENLKKEIKKGPALKRTQSVDKSSPILQAEIEEAPSASIDGDLKKDIKKGKILTKTASMQTTANDIDLKVDIMKGSIYLDYSILKITVIGRIRRLFPCKSVYVLEANHS